MHHALIAALLALLLAGCAATGPAPGSGSSEAPAAAFCPLIDLRSPSGVDVALTGTWLSNDFGTYAIQQVRSCVYWVGQSRAYPPDYPAGAAWTNVFAGRAASDFTIRGEWADVPAYPEGAPLLSHGRLELEISFPSESEDEPSMRLLAQEPPGVFGGQVWFAETSVAPPAELLGVYGFDTPFCPWFEVDGDRMEAAFDVPYLITAQGAIIDEDFGSRIQVRPGDQVRVTGSVAPYPGPADCASSTILVTEIGPALP